MRILFFGGLFSNDRDGIHHTHVVWVAVSTVLLWVVNRNALVVVETLAQQQNNLAVQDANSNRIITLNAFCCFTFSLSGHRLLRLVVDLFSEGGIAQHLKHLKLRHCLLFVAHRSLKHLHAIILFLLPHEHQNAEGQHCADHQASKENQILFHKAKNSLRWLSLVDKVCKVPFLIHPF